MQLNRDGSSFWKLLLNRLPNQFDWIDPNIDRNCCVSSNFLHFFSLHTTRWSSLTQSCGEEASFCLWWPLPKMVPSECSDFRQLEFALDLRFRREFVDSTFANPRRKHWNLLKQCLNGIAPKEEDLENWPKFHYSTYCFNGVLIDANPTTCAIYGRFSKFSSFVLVFRDQKYSQNSLCDEIISPKRAFVNFALNRANFWKHFLTNQSWDLISNFSQAFSNDFIAVTF